MYIIIKKIVYTSLENPLFFEKIKKTEPHLSRETRNEGFKNKFFPVSKIYYFLKFLEFQKYFLFFQTILKFITSIKNFLVEIFWEKNFSFFSNIIYFVQVRSQKNFMSKSKNVLSDYVEKWSDLGSFFLKRKKTKTKIENKNFKNLIQVFSKKKILMNQKSLSVLTIITEILFFIKRNDSSIFFSFCTRQDSNLQFPVS